RPLGSRPPLPRSLRGRVHVRTALGAEARRDVLRDAAIFVPAVDGSPRVALEAAAAGAAVASPPARSLQPELAAAEAARLMAATAFRSERAHAGVESARGQSYAALADTVTEVYAAISSRRRPAAARDPLGDRDWIIADLHMHTSWSHDCSIDVDDLVDHAE